MAHCKMPRVRKPKIVRKCRHSCEGANGIQQQRGKRHQSKSEHPKRERNYPNATVCNAEHLSRCTDFFSRENTTDSEAPESMKM
mmetsp:Transcript_17867/g.41209  ORF Transcript_17867/g.41209 Transcript_17867/m.41209 type:complete len:84 (+) Transcript_17867:2233-2484(+)